MKQYKIKPGTMLVGVWDGAQDAPIVTEIREAGWEVFFQQADTETIEVWLPDHDEPVEMDCPARMVIVGRWRGQLHQVDAGGIITYRSGDRTLRCWASADHVLDNWVEGSDGGDAFPTPDQLHEIEINADF